MHVFPSACQRLGPGCAQEPHRPGQGLCEAVPSGWPTDAPLQLLGLTPPPPTTACLFCQQFSGCNLEKCTVMIPGASQNGQMLQGGHWQVTRHGPDHHV